MTAARVLNPAVITDFCLSRASPTTSVLSRNLPCGHHLNRIKRDLFGPVNPVEISKTCAEELEKYQERALKKWGFDFCAGVPAGTNSQFLWERVSFQESHFVPEMYTLTRAAHLRPEVEQHTAIDLLMDERSERENFANISASTDESCDESQDETTSTVVFKVPAVAGHSSSETTLTLRCGNKSQLRKRQPKITEYMKERKRLAQTPKKKVPAKRMRTNSGSSSSNSIGVSHSTQPNSISSHFSLRSLQRHH